MVDIKLYNGDCMEKLKELADNSVDSIVTDPPYGIKFMNKKWDYGIPSVEHFKEMLRVLKHGGHILCACGTRTQHRMACNIEDAGFEIRDVISWIYGSGFPKSHNIGKAVDKLQGNEREWVSENPNKASEEAEMTSAGKCQNGRTTHPDITKGSSPHEGWGTALKPAQEFFTLARKPLSEKTVAKNVLRWGTGGINIDECRVELNATADKSQLRTMNRSKKDEKNGWGMNQANKDTPQVVNPQGRFPANIIWSCFEDEYVIKSSISDEDILTIKNYFNGKKT